METALEQLKSWETEGVFAGAKMAINVSARQFLQKAFAEEVGESLARIGCDPTRVVLELTESLLVESTEEVVGQMMALKRLGVRFALDDFGTGCSSLSNLKMLPISQIKMDQSFIRDIVDDANDAAIVETVLAISRTLGIEFIAEGVETADQRAFLARHGCHFFQGFLFSEPRPSEDWGNLPPAAPGHTTG